MGRILTIFKFKIMSLESFRPLFLFPSAKLINLKKIVVKKFKIKLLHEHLMQSLKLIGQNLHT